MNNTDKVYLIKWVGPFSYDELYNWEKKWLENISGAIKTTSL